ncbi:MAG: shikimate dehydrogenase [Actinophytocola sp.]|uniref:shikimate dehydrogenase n=1 Tax=Actinophytocola sp. TaxID=1872138 RepID=UPI0013259834|nr:shikimate dehydrogenase [Actinophytocola sp.]MPZ82260.1 shikimate dehydrogenase [Actinophytocola sp.]
MLTDVRRAAVLGSPVAHSLSPVLHGAAYRALGLTAWTYDRVEVSAAGLPAFVSSLDSSWVGLSVTMPGKHAALAAASSATPRAVAVGAANTLVRRDSGWHADCTDVDGVVGALRAAGFAGSGYGVVLGAGGTACAALAGLFDLGISRAHVVARDPARAESAVACGAKLGLPVEVVGWSSASSASSASFGALAAGAAVLVNTAPAGAVPPSELALAPCVLDVVYHPWPTPLASAVAERGGVLATGLDMLLHQAFGQVEQFTGEPAPRAAMRDALHEATGGILPLRI